MPYKPKRPCAKPGCPNLTTEKYCAVHFHFAEQEQRERDKRRHEKYDREKRDRRAAAFYNSPAWKRLRRHRLMIDHGLCQDCLLENRITPADVVDHIKPVRMFWHLRLRLDNTRSLCHACHNRKTAEDKRRYKGG